MRDPRDRYRILPRDLVAGLWIGQGYEVAQYQLHEAVFPGKSAVVVSRFVRRWKERGLLAVERWNRIGINRLRLTSKGRDLILLSGAAKPEDLFVPKRPVAPKDLAHRLWVNDLRVVLDRLPRKPEIILPHWAIERRFIPRWPAIPDLLAVFSAGGDGGKLALAIEVDLGGEPLRSVFVPKLKILQDVLAEIGQGDQAAILILTAGARRREGLAKAVAAFDGSIPLAVRTLPDGKAGAALDELAGVFIGSVNSCAHEAADNP
jgi:hypothetical protein